MGSWLVVVVVLVVGRASAQLGEGYYAPDYYDYEKDYEETEDVSAGVGVASWGGAVRGATHFWRPLEWLRPRDTYLGCLNRTSILGGLSLHVNLSEISVVLHENGCAASCARLCQNKMPFAEFISVTKGGDVFQDTCACHYYQDLLWVFEDDGACDGSLDHARLYCGAANKDCYNAASLAAPSLTLAGLALLLASWGL